MKRTPILTVAAIAASMFLVSCKNNSTSGLAIPKDAAMVLQVNTSSLTSKLSWEEIKATNWFREMAKDANDSLAKKMLENPENSGIDLKGDLVYFMKKQGKGGYMVLEGKLKDAAAFEAMVKQIKTGATTQKDGDLSYIVTDDNNIVSWTSNQFFAMSDAPFFAMNPYGMDENSDVKFPTDSLKKFTKDLLALKSDDALTKDDRFNDLVKADGDVHFWINSDQTLSNMGSYLSMLKVGSLLKGNALAYSLNFENGKIAVKAKSYFGEEMSKLMDKYASRNVDKDLINRIPSQNVVGVMAMNFDPAIIKEFLVAAGVDGMLNGMLGKQGLSVDDLVNASKGQFLVSISDVTVTKKEKVIPAFYEGGEPYTYTTTEPEMNFLFATSVNNKATFDKILGLAKEEMGNSMEDTSKLNFKANNEWFAVSNRNSTVDQFMAGGNNKFAFADKISGHPFGLYIDLQKAMKAGASTMENAGDSAAFDASLKMWEDVVATGGEYKKGVATMEFVVNLVDKSKNSLKQINEYGDKIFAAKQLRRKNNEGFESADTTAVVPPVMEVEPK